MNDAKKDNRISPPVQEPPKEQHLAVPVGLAQRIATYMETSGTGSVSYRDVAQMLQELVKCKPADD